MTGGEGVATAGGRGPLGFDGVFDLVACPILVRLAFGGGVLSSMVLRSDPPVDPRKASLPSFTLFLDVLSGLAPVAVPAFRFFFLVDTKKGQSTKS